MKVVHDWYWARGQAGPYSVIASYITSAKPYGFEPIPIFMLARDNVVIGDDPVTVVFEREGIYIDATTGKPVATTTRYIYENGWDRYVVSFTRTRDLSLNRMIDGVKGSSVSPPDSRVSTAHTFDSRATSRCRITVAAR